MVCERSEVFASACAIARAFPLFTRRSSASRRADKKSVTVEFVLIGQNNGPMEFTTLKVVWNHCLPLPRMGKACLTVWLFLYQCLESATEGVRLAARIVDTPCNEMNTDHFVEVSTRLSVTPVYVPVSYGSPPLPFLLSPPDFVLQSN